MNSFYFTFGSMEQYPYQGGWVEVLAEDINEAQQNFKSKYPNINDCLNCASVYSEKEFFATEMIESGNRGAFCHEVIL